jgi:hypothetical protein
MPIAASSLIQRATGLLQDPTSIRWPVNELVRWLNDGQREIVLIRPDAINVTATMTLAAGSRQDLDAATGITVLPIKLIEITRNLAATSTKQSVTMVPRKIMDAQTPNWHQVTPSVNILHYMFDTRDPKTFYVYPPATVLAQLEVNYSGYPTDIAEPADGVLWGAVTGNITVPDIYGSALVDYMLYRAYSKDASYAGNAQRASSYLAVFNGALGIERSATEKFSPVVSREAVGDMASAGPRE